jgi:predicted transcriptional regulator
MISTEIQLSEEQMKALEMLAEAQNKPADKLIIEAIDVFLRAVLEERKRRALSIAGRFHSGISDLSDNHDQHLAKVYEG